MRGRQCVWWVLLVGCALGLGACGSGNEDAESPPPAPTSRVPGFDEVAFTVQPPGTPATDDTPDYCALLADSEDRWEQGMTGRRDLADYDGMVFTFDRDVESGFHMRDTPMPLSIAWLDANGEFVSSTDMEPCLNRPECPAYRAPRPYRYAIEVARGDLGRLKIGPGAVVDIGGRCRSES